MGIHCRDGAIGQSSPSGGVTWHTYGGGNYPLIIFLSSFFIRKVITTGSLCMGADWKCDQLQRGHLRLREGRDN